MALYSCHTPIKSVNDRIMTRIEKLCNNADIIQGGRMVGELFPYQKGCHASVASLVSRKCPVFIIMRTL